MFKWFVKHRLEGYVKKYFKRHPNTKLVAVVGSVGKTTTKRAVATMLASSFKLQGDVSDFNEQIAVPCSILGVNYPPTSELRKLSTWRTVFKACKHQAKDMDVAVIVQELGTDHPGEIPHFAKYLKPDITIITAVTPEHMEFFKTLQAVAQEEFALAAVSKKVMVNIDDTPIECLQYVDPAKVLLYGFDEHADYTIKAKVDDPLKGYSGQFISKKNGAIDVKDIKLVGEHNLRAGIAAAGVATELGLDAAKIQHGLTQVQSAPGRMNILRGNKNSVILDDTYNSSPAAAIAALRTLYETVSDERIAVFGGMNELGEYAEQGHKDVAEFFDGTYLSYLVTMGNMANKYFAPIARAKGITVFETKTPIEAGIAANKVLDPEKNPVVLFKGSQGGIYMEEAVKIIVFETEHDKLVRQSPEWRAKKEYLYEQEFADAETDDE
ncbi:UDP-N-acetylmuramoyl-tripeptide--D-alanyl-D-alanine ligase [Candidatus Saccharibacteria bacterium]|nr:UDP-N-acetylmuramoyl-tripeptide--D-alanyl-D-alanine ligase [Candidatus Saccharibacteria bacterium]